MHNDKEFDILEKLGVLVPFDEELTLFHSDIKIDDSPKDWWVDPFIDFYGSNKEEIFSPIQANSCKLLANKLYNRAKDIIGLSNAYFQPETLKILPFEKGKYFLNANFDFTKLKNQEKEVVLNALKIDSKADSIHVSKRSKPSFFEQSDFHLVYKEIVKLQNWEDDDFITFNMLDNFCLKNNCSKKLAKKVAGIINAIKSLNHNFTQALTYAFKCEEINNMPFDKEYILSWAKENNIIGFSQEFFVDKISPAQRVYTIFDKTAVGSEKQVLKRQNLKNRERKFFSVVENLTADEKLEIFLKKSNPQEIVDYCMNLPFEYKGRSYKQIFNLNANVIPENFIIAEHTETVLRVFDDSFKDRFPEELLPFIRLVIVCHDIGKGFTQYFKDPNQKHYNEMVAKDYLTQLGVDKKIRELVLFIIGDSQRFTHKYIVERDIEGRKLLELECNKVLQGLGLDCDEDMILALTNICLTLQSCDGGAYTIYAVTRDRQNNIDAEYKNFNERFSQAYMHTEMGTILPNMIYTDEERE